MVQVNTPNQKKQSPQPVKNPYETAAQNGQNYDPTLTGFGKNMAKSTASAFGDIGSGIFDQILGGGPANTTQIADKMTDNAALESQYKAMLEKQKNKSKNESFRRERKTVFDRVQIEQSRQQEQKIKQLQEVIRQEIKAFKKTSDEANQEADMLQRLVLEEKSTSNGIYYINFLEQVVAIMRSLRAKVGESRTWMQAMISKKQKRGSAFAARAKKGGNAYTQSQEHSVSRSVQ